MGFAASVKRWLLGSAPVRAPEPSPVTRAPRGQVYSPSAAADLAALFAAKAQVPATWQAPTKPVWLDKWMQGKGAGRTLAMDSVPYDDLADYAAMSGPWSEGLGFMGYAYLAEVQQRPEYRRIPEIWAAECTRKWIKLKGDDPARLAKLEGRMRHFGVREKMREAVELDGGFGRAHVFMDFGDKQGERDGPLVITPETVVQGSLKNLKVVEPYWVYPLNFNTLDPLADDYYCPSHWLVMGEEVHTSRLLTIVGREVPDILKPVYMFGGLSLTQMVKPAVDNFIRNRKSIGDLLHAFSTMVLATNMGSMLSPEGASEMVRRVGAFVYGRENGGLMLVDKETEELKNVSAPLGSVDSLLAQSMEMILIPAGIPMVVYAGTTPSGLNASSDGELKAFYGHVKGYNEKTLGGPLQTILRVLQLDMDGTIDESVTFEFVDGWELDEGAKATMRQANMTTATGYIQAGVISPENERERLTGEEGGLYYGMKLEEPEVPMDMGDGEGEEDDDGDDKDPPGGGGGGKANDSGSQHWITAHPDGPDSKGTPLLIGGDGTVEGGAGGKLNGQKLNHVTSRSAARMRGDGPERPAGHEDPVASAPSPVRNDGEGAGGWAKRLGEHADKVGGVENHRAAQQAHEEARDVFLGKDMFLAGHHRNEALRHKDAHKTETLGKDWHKDEAEQAGLAADLASTSAKDITGHAMARAKHNDAYSAYEEALRVERMRDPSVGYNHPLADKMSYHSAQSMKHTNAAQALAKKQAKEQMGEGAWSQLPEGTREHVERVSNRFAKHSRAQLREHLAGYSMGLNDEADLAQAKAMTKDPAFLARYQSADPETRAAARAEFEAARIKGQEAVRFAGHKGVDLNSKGTGAKATRAQIGHMVDGLEHLERQGYDVKGALAQASVQYLAGTPTSAKTNGHATQHNGTGYFALNHDRTGPDRLLQGHKSEEKRQGKGAPWSQSYAAGPKHAARTTAIHELAHALGMQEHIKSPDRLQGILASLHPDKDHKGRNEWIKNNISTYAGENKHETDAELAALVTAEHYKPGTLPKELEDHVKWLFNPK